MERERKTERQRRRQRDRERRGERQRDRERRERDKGGRERERREISTYMPIYILIFFKTITFHFTIIYPMAKNKLQTSK